MGKHGKGVGRWVASMCSKGKNRWIAALGMGMHGEGNGGQVAEEDNNNKKEDRRRRRRRRRRHNNQIQRREMRVRRWWWQWFIPVVGLAAIVFGCNGGSNNAVAMKMTTPSSESAA
jgi:hypothetical protein